MCNCVSTAKERLVSFVYLIVINYVDVIINGIILPPGGRRRNKGLVVSHLFSGFTLTTTNNLEEEEEEEETMSVCLSEWMNQEGIRVGGWVVAPGTSSFFSFLVYCASLPRPPPIDARHAAPCPSLSLFFYFSLSLPFLYAISSAHTVCATTPCWILSLFVFIYLFFLSSFFPFFK